MYKKFSIIVLFLCLTLFLPACAKREDHSAVLGLGVYYLGKDTTKIVFDEWEEVPDREEDLLVLLLEKLQTQPENTQYKPPVSGFQVIDYHLENDQISINVSQEYVTQDVTREVLARAAIVKTLSQLEGITYVSILVENMPLLDAVGNLVGPMRADYFVDNTGNEFTAYEKVSLRLYFASAGGDRLVAVTKNVVYNSHIALDKLVVEQIIAGPPEDSRYAFSVMGADTKVVSVTTKDGICYVNFSENFMTQSHTVPSGITLYAIVNSLAELSGINKVQFSVNGRNDMVYGESVSLSTVFERNLDLVEGN